MSDLKRTEAPWRGVALVCRKCTKKLNGGFGRKGKHPLAAELKEALRDAGQRRMLRVIEVDCLGLCPKNAVTVIGPGRSHEMLVVPRRTDPVEVMRAFAEGLARWRSEVTPIQPDEPAEAPATAGLAPPPAER